MSHNLRVADHTQRARLRHHFSPKKGPLRQRMSVWDLIVHTCSIFTLSKSTLSLIGVADLSLPWQLWCWNWEIKNVKYVLSPGPNEQHRTHGQDNLCLKLDVHHFLIATSLFLMVFNLTEAFWSDYCSMALCRVFRQMIHEIRCTTDLQTYLIVPSTSTQSSAELNH